MIRTGWIIYWRFPLFESVFSLQSVKTIGNTYVMIYFTLCKKITQMGGFLSYFCYICPNSNYSVLSEYMYLGVPLLGQKSCKSIQIRQMRALDLRDFEQICGISRRRLLLFWFAEHVYQRVLGSCHLDAEMLKNQYSALKICFFWNVTIYLQHVFWFRCFEIVPRGW